MRKTIVLALLLACGGACMSHAVVIHWATDGVPANTASAMLVYVSADSTPPAYAGGVISTGVELGDEVSGLAITPAGIGEQTTSDVMRSSGAYYIVLFNYTLGQYAVSSSALAWNDAAAISTSEFDIITDYFTPSTFTDWANVPEPGTAMLLMVGAAISGPPARRSCRPANSRRRPSADRAAASVGTPPARPAALHRADWNGTGPR